MKKQLLLSLLIFLNSNSFAMNRMIDKAVKIRRTAFTKNPNLLGNVCNDIEVIDTESIEKIEKPEIKQNSGNRYFKIKNLIFFCTLIAVLYKLLEIKI